MADKNEAPRRISVWNPVPMSGHHPRADEFLYINAAVLRELIELWTGLSEDSEDATQRETLDYCRDSILNIINPPIGGGRFA